MADDEQDPDHRRHPRFQYGGTAMLVFDDENARRTLAITNYRNISQGGACILTPDVKGFAPGDRMYLMPERYRRKREAVVVDLGTGRLHLEIPRSQELSEFEVAEILEKLNQFDSKD
jgi:hypothetical protein